MYVVLPHPDNTWKNKSGIQNEIIPVLRRIFRAAGCPFSGLLSTSGGREFLRAASYRYVVHFFCNPSCSTDSSVVKASKNQTVFTPHELVQYQALLQPYFGLQRETKLHRKLHFCWSSATGNTFCNCCQASQALQGVKCVKCGKTHNNTILNHGRRPTSLITDTRHQRQMAPCTTTLNSMLVIKAVNWTG